jgi:hypothetical protein
MITDPAGVRRIRLTTLGHPPYLLAMVERRGHRTKQRFTLLFLGLALIALAFLLISRIQIVLVFILISLAYMVFFETIAPPSPARASFALPRRTSARAPPRGSSR